MWLKRLLLTTVFCSFSSASFTMDHATLKNIANCDKYWGKEIKTKQEVLAKFLAQLDNDGNNWWLKDRVKDLKVYLEKLNRVLSFCYAEGFEESKKTYHKE